jgi:Lrp/AsnC family transcriptional regulator for asnA, asnC and gidA
MVHHFDETDQQILQLLHENSRQPYHSIAKKINKPTSTVHSRVQWMKAQGIITRFSIKMNPSKFGFATKAWVGLTVKEKEREKVAAKLGQFPEITMIGASLGPHNISLEVLAQSHQDLDQFIQEKLVTALSDSLSGDPFYVVVFTRNYPTYTQLHTKSQPLLRTILRRKNK